MKYQATFVEKRIINGHYYNEYSEITVEAEDRAAALEKLQYRKHVNEKLVDFKEIKSK